jgi:hypothetical protein
MIEILKRCSICKNEQCDGREFRVHGTYYRGFDMDIDKIVCSSQVEYLKDGTYRYKLIIGHGDWEYLPAIPI